jgi:outer membrane protein, multidrug efflux system
MRWLLFGIGLTVGGCALHTVDKDVAPVLERVTLAESFSRAGAGRELDARWWSEYGDPGLDQAVDAAISGNLDLAVAYERVLQAGALVRQAGASWWPTLDLSVSANRQRMNVYPRDFLPDEASGLVEDTGAKGIEVGSYPMSVAATYEVDLWGRIGHVQSGAEARARSGALDAVSLAMTIRAQVVDLWFAIAEARGLRALMDEQIETANVYLKLTEERFSLGQASTLDIRQQRRELAALSAELPLLDAQREVLIQQLHVLSGRAPHADTGGALPDTRLPGVPSIPTVGVPAELLRRRPDLVALETAVRAADHDVGVAIAAQFPSLRLTASTGFQDREIGDLFGAWVWNLVGNLTAPIFDGGRRSAEVDRRRAALKESVLRYEKGVLQAMAEVEEALTRLEHQGHHVSALDVQLAEARATLQEARARYGQGLITYLPVLGALKSVQGTERQRLRAQRTHLSYGVQLARALGGGWNASTDPTAHEPGAP